VIIFNSHESTIYISFIHFPVNYHEPPDTFSLKLHAANKNPAAKRKWISKYDRRAMVSNRSSVFHAEITAVYDRWRNIRTIIQTYLAPLALRAAFSSSVCIASFLQWRFQECYRNPLYEATSRMANNGHIERVASTIRRRESNRGVFISTFRSYLSLFYAI